MGSQNQLSWVRSFAEMIGRIPRLLIAGPSNPTASNLPRIRALPPVADAGNQAPPLGLAIDFGTSATAVATVPDALQRMILAKIDLDDPRRELIGSEMFHVTEGGPEGVAMGSASLPAMLRNQGAHGRYYSSLKRVLFALDRALANGTNAADQWTTTLRLAFRELLRLTIDPQQSFAYARLLLIQQGGGQDAAAAGEKLSRLGSNEFGLPHLRHLLDREPARPVTIWLSVPNSVSDRIVEVLRETMMRAAREVVGNARPLSVEFIPEAEAVAADPNNNVRPNIAASHPQLVLCLDIGAGTTDATLVERFAGQAVAVARTGVPIGGDDLDILLYALFLLRQQGVAAFRDEIGNRLSTAAESLEFLRELRNAKERWSNNCRGQWDQRYPVGLLPEIFTNWKAMIDRPEREWSGPIVEAAAGNQVVDSITWQFGGGRTLHSPLNTVGYARFLAFSVASVVTPLLDFIRIRGMQLGGAILSGKGSLAPGVREMLLQVLSNEGTHARIHQPEDPKLTCVRGTAHYQAAGFKPAARDQLLGEALFVGNAGGSRLLAPRGLRWKDRMSLAFESGRVNADMFVDREFCRANRRGEGYYWWVLRRLARISHPGVDHDPPILFMTVDSRKEVAGFWSWPGGARYENVVMLFGGPEDILLRQNSVLHGVEDSLRWGLQ